MTVRGREFRWSREEGLDPAAVLELRPWIARCAQPYMRRAAGLHLELRDLLQAGALGALRAARTFDPRRKRGFITWATYKIREEMHALCGGPFTEPLDAGDPGAAGDPGDPGVPALEAAQLLRRLPRGDRALLRRYFGIGSGRGASMAGMARERGVSATSVSQMLGRALYRARKIANQEGRWTWTRK